MTREEMLKDIYDFYEVISKLPLKGFEHFKSMSANKSDEEISSDWLTIKKLISKKK